MCMSAHTYTSICLCIGLSLIRNIIVYIVCHRMDINVAAELKYTIVPLYSGLYMHLLTQRHSGRELLHVR